MDKWTPLLAVVGERTGEFDFFGWDEELYQYRHRNSRHYLNLDVECNAYAVAYLWLDGELPRRSVRPIPLDEAVAVAFGDVL